MDPIRDDVQKYENDLDESENTKHISARSFEAKRSTTGKRVTLSPIKANGQTKSYTFSRMFSGSLKRLHN